MATDAQQKIETYLTRLRGKLCGLAPEDVREIVEELRSHIMDKAAASGETTAAVEQALAALGSPEELAREYATDTLLARAQSSRSPLRILESLYRWASLSVAGFVVLLVAILGYFLGSVFVLCAVLKPFHPHTAGLWVFPGGEISFRLGFGNAPVTGHEVLGWWMVPVGLVSGCALVMLTTQFALWCARQYRRSRAAWRLMPSQK